MKYIPLISFLTILWITPVSCQEKVNITINADSILHPISPYIYGKNNCISDNESNPTSASEWQRLRDLGIRFFRESGGGLNLH
jgi:hypothetical protein